MKFFRYLKEEVDKGHSIGALAELGREELLKRSKVAAVESPHVEAPAEQLVAELTSAIQQHAVDVFERKLNGALAVIPFEEALHRFLFPVLERVGDLWHEGKISVAQEHYVSNLVKQKVYSAMNQLRVLENGPKVVVACPHNESHEIGALTAAYVCAARGCRTYYLGLRMPIDELVSYCSTLNPSLVLFSVTIVLSGDEANELASAMATKLLSYSPVGVGGRGVLPHTAVFEQEKISIFRNLKDLEVRLLTLTTH
ncbi:MAG: hypothetical protein NPIRA02_39560 [Nitrospirales bacterium]|nr:MAG: hypothetical protein NPIRA02_39560 [Nitrospirales bacterium]